MHLVLSTRGKALCLSILVLALVGVVAGCGSSSSSSSSSESTTTTESETGGGNTANASTGGEGLPSTINVGWLDSMTGIAGFCGVDELKGAKLAIEQAEKSGELGESKIQLDEFDDTSTPATGVVGFHKLASEEVSAIVGPCLDLVATAVMPLTQEEEIPMVLTTDNASDLSDSFVFRTGVRDVDIGANVINYLAEQGVKKAGLLCENNDPSNAEFCKEEQIPAIEEAGMELVSKPTASSTATDFSTQVQELMKGDPEAVGVIMDGTANISIVNELRQAGYKGKIWVGVGADSEYFFHEGGPNVEGVLLSVAYSSADESTVPKEFTEAYKAKYGQDPADLNAHGYDGMRFLIQGIKEAESAEPAAIQKALSGIKTFEGAQGEMTFDSEGSATAKGGVAEVKNGELVGLE